MTTDISTPDPEQRSGTKSSTSTPTSVPIRYRHDIAGTQPPPCSQQGEDLNPHIGYGDIVIYEWEWEIEELGGEFLGEEVESTRRIRKEYLCYPCAFQIALALVSKSTGRTLAIHGAMARGMKDDRLMRARVKIMTQMAETRLKSVALVSWRLSGADVRHKNDEISHRSGQTWGARLQELLIDQGIDDEDEMFQIDYSAADRKEVGGNCKCGCGERTKKVGSDFRAGHDARFYSSWRKYLNEDLEWEQVPVIAQTEILERQGKGQDPWH